MSFPCQLFYRKSGKKHLHTVNDDWCVYNESTSKHSIGCRVKILFHLNWKKALLLAVITVTLRTRSIFDFESHVLFRLTLHKVFVLTNWPNVHRAIHLGSNWFDLWTLNEQDGNASDAHELWSLIKWREHVNDEFISLGKWMRAT